MKLRANTFLITGGSEGIGFSLAQALVADNTVIVCGRSAEKLARAKEQLPELHVEVCDITDPVQRQAMVGRVLKKHPRLNVLINNAGAKQRTELAGGRDPEAAMDADMALNFTAPVALCTALLPHLHAQPEAAIVNMSSGLVFLPKAEQAFYCAAKAALHSYSQSLGWALQGSSVKVHEVFLTLVDTAFHRGRLPTNIPAISAEVAARSTLQGLAQGRCSIYVGKARLARWLALLAPRRGRAIVNR